jgi:hypothetical protein
MHLKKNQTTKIGNQCIHKTKNNNKPKAWIGNKRITKKIQNTHNQQKQKGNKCINQTTKNKNTT